MMTESLDAIRNLDDLRVYVHDTLCHRENILSDQFATTATPLKRAGRVCGFQYCLQGPRSVRLMAIWAVDHNLLYFYDARGERFLKVQLPQRLNVCVA